MRDLLEMFVTESQYKNLSPLTAKIYKTDIGYLIDFLEVISITDIEKLSLPHLKRWVVEMQKRPKLIDLATARLGKPSYG